MENENRQPGLYNPAFEHDNCGIGAVVSIKGIKTHQTVSVFKVFNYTKRIRQYLMRLV